MAKKAKLNAESNSGKWVPLNFLTLPPEFGF